MKEKNPDLSPTDIARKLGEIWQQMSSKFLHYYSALYSPAHFYPIGAYTYRLRSQIQ